MDKTHLADLADIVELLARRPERFIIYCDDLSFEEGDDAYKALKTALDGGLARRADNVLIYATSNRRHLMPERMQDNLDSRNVNGEIHPGEAVEEKSRCPSALACGCRFTHLTRTPIGRRGGVAASPAETHPAPNAPRSCGRSPVARSGRVGLAVCLRLGRAPQAERKGRIKRHKKT